MWDTVTVTVIMDRFIIKKPCVEFEEELASKTDGEKPTCSTSDSSMIEFEKEEGLRSYIALRKI